MIALCEETALEKQLRCRFAEARKERTAAQAPPVLLLLRTMTCGSVKGGADGVIKSSGGTATLHDALARPTQVVADSELGKLTTRFDYLNGFQKRVTNPRSHSITNSYQVFDEPTENALIRLDEPESVTVAIARDVFGKPKSVTRSGPGVSATRSYVYDANQRLCKTVEPETGATVQTYDAANNTVWRAAGLPLPSLTCDPSSVPAANKVSYSYDTRNRLTATNYGDGSPSITRTYTPDCEQQPESTLKQPS